MLSVPSTEIAGEDLLPDARPGCRPYRATVAGIRRLSRHFVRVTFTGPEFEHFGTAGLDHRIKLVLPIPGVGLGSTCESRTGAPSPGFPAAAPRMANVSTPPCAPGSAGSS